MRIADLTKWLEAQDPETVIYNGLGEGFVAPDSSEDVVFTLAPVTNIRQMLTHVRKMPLEVRCWKMTQPATLSGANVVVDCEPVTDALLKYYKLVGMIIKIQQTWNSTDFPVGYFDSLLEAALKEVRDA